MDLEKIEALVKILESSSLTEMKIEDKDFKISMSKQDKSEKSAIPYPVPMAMPVPDMEVNLKKSNHIDEDEDEDIEDEDIEYITSPIVATFYSASAPEVPAYVKVGDHVKAGEPICILEAMKLMNEITSDYDCIIEAVLVSNEQKVEYGQPLFRVKRI